MTLAKDSTRRRYWVVGGLYSSTDFRELASGAREQRFGPYDSYEEALAEWQARAWQSVDNCHARYRIVEEPETAARLSR